MRHMGSFARARPPAVAGLFYPAEREALERTVAECLAAAAPIPALPGRVKALIAPHAGYVYSGPIAGSAFRSVESLRGTVERVILLGPTHRFAFAGIAVPTVDAFETPLGSVPVDDAARRELLALPEVIEDDRPHADEHCLEVELPFLQTLFGNVRVLPVVVGRIAPERLAVVLERLWGGPETLIVVSSDLSHYHDDATAKRIDRATGAAIAERTSALTHDQACGATVINGLMVAARQHGLEVLELDRRTSADTAGDPRRVVGYAAYALHEPC